MTTFTKNLLRGCVVAAAAITLLCAAPLQRTAHAEADPKTTFAAIKKLDKAGEGGKAVAALVALESDQRPAITKELAGLAVKAKTAQVAIIAMRMCAKRKDPGFHKKLGGLLKDKRKYAKEAPARFIGILQAAELYEDPKLSKALWGVVSKYTNTNSDFTSAALAAYGSVRSKDVVEQLIKHLPVTENRATNLNADTKKNLRRAKSAIFKTLYALTGKDIGDSKMWKDFWKEKGKKFEFPDLNVPEVDITTLREHTDTSYNFKVTLPDAKVTLKKTEEEVFGWRFLRGREEIRFQASVHDETDWEVARIEFLVLNASKGAYTTPAKMAEWWEGEVRTNLIVEFSKEPEIKKLTLNGRKWVQGVARGQPGNGQKGWGTAERRMYCAKSGHMLIYCTAVIRSGAADDVKKQAYAIMENIIITEE